VHCCENYITLSINVQTPPTIALQITSATDIVCQNLGTPAKMRMLQHQLLEHTTIT
jgi:hypothetical protein